MRHYRFLLSVILVFFTFNAYAIKIDNIYYNLSSNTASVTYYQISSSNSSAYQGYVVIPNEVEYNGKKYTVNAIGANAFYKCTNLDSISIPSTVTSIGNAAFCESGIKKIIIPESVKTMGISVFNHSYLRSICFPDNMEVIRQGMCEACSSLQEVKLGKNTKIIEAYSFSACSQLKSFTFTENIDSVGYYVFGSSTHLTNVTFQSIESLFNIKGSLPIESNTHIFIREAELLNLKVPSYVQTITHSRLNSSFLKSIILHKDVKEFQSYCLSNTNLTDVYFYAKNPPQITDGVFKHYGTLHVPQGCKNNYGVLEFWSNFNIVDDLKTTYPIDVEDILLTKNNIVLTVGAQIPINANVLPEDAYNTDVEFISENPKICRMENNIINALSAGTTYIIAKAKDANATIKKCKVRVFNDDEYKEVLSGDVNVDGKIDITDVTTLVNKLINVK